MDRSAIEEETLAAFQSGFCCAESLLRTILRHYAPDAPPETCRVASGFVGGVGKSKEDVCGAFTGGVMALSYIHGRSELDTDITPLLTATTKFREEFIARCGSTSCPALLDKFGDQEDMGKCKSMTAGIAGLVAQLVEDPSCD